MSKVTRRTLTPQYLVLMLLADILIGLGLVGYFFPELLAPVGDDLARWTHINWYWVIAMGGVTGLVNFLLYRSGADRRWD